MTTDHLPPSDDERADLAWSNAALTATVRHILPTFIPMLIGAVPASASLALAVYAMTMLTGLWGSLSIAWLASVLLYWTITGIRTKRKIKATQRKPIDQRREQALNTIRNLSAESRWRFLRYPIFWLNRLAITLPKAALGTYALATWWPLPAAIAVAALPFAWSFISHMSQNADKRILPAMTLLLDRRDPEGLPTPEM
jgi:hypothetical protein